MKLALLLPSLCLLVASYLLADSQDAKPADQLQGINQKEYAGSQTCAGCHKDYYGSWKESGHNQMIRPAVADGPGKTILADFSKPDPNRPFELKETHSGSRSESCA